MIELETSLSKARLARGLTLEDAERSTRIARKYLIALEEQNYGVFPAPVYARGFLRTYCRYLGVDPEPHLAGLPASWSGQASTTQSAPAGRAVGFNATWLLAGAAIVVIAVGAILFLNQGDGATDNQQLTTPPGTDTQNQNTSTGPQNAGVGVPIESTVESVGRPLQPGLPGSLPDLIGVETQEALDFLEGQGVDYLLIEQTDSSNPAGIITWQSAPRGTSTAELPDLTLAASLGTRSEEAREDCNVLRDSNRRSATEQTWYEATCLVPPTPIVPPDRTNCAEIRGTPYRSPGERQFFLTNCVG